MKRKTVTKRNVHPLIKALNGFSGIWASTESPASEPRDVESFAKDGYCVHFQVEDGSDGETSLQFLAWIVNGVVRSQEPSVVMWPSSMAPYMCNPGVCMHWVLECRTGMPAKSLARMLDAARKSVYLAYDEVVSDVVAEEVIYDMRLWAERVLNKGIDGNQFAKCVKAMQESGREQSASIRNMCRLIKSGRKKFSSSKIASLLQETADRYEAMNLSGGGVK